MSNMEVDEGTRVTGDLSAADRAKQYLSRIKAVTSGGTADGKGNLEKNIADEIPSLDSTYRAIKNCRVHSLKCKKISGQGETKSFEYGSFHNPGDTRMGLAFCRSNFDPCTLLCQNCETKGPHKVNGMKGKGETGDELMRVFLLLDQNFPAALPVSGPGSCNGIIWVEYGSLKEIARTFVDVVAGHGVRVGSLLLLGSVSAIAELGTAGYAEDLVRTAKYLLDSLDGKVQVRACPLIPTILPYGVVWRRCVHGSRVGSMVFLRGSFPDTSQSASCTIL